MNEGWSGFIKMRQSIAIGKEKHYIIIKGLVYQKDITIPNVYAKQKFKICEAKPDIIQKRNRQIDISTW